MESQSHFSASVMSFITIILFSLVIISLVLATLNKEKMILKASTSMGHLSNLLSAPRKKLYKYFILFLGVIVSILFSLQLPVVPPEYDTFGSSIWIVLLVILLIPYLMGLCYYALLKNKLQSIFKMLFIGIILLSVVFLINLIIHSGTPDKHVSILFSGLYDLEEITYPLYPFEWVGNFSIVFSLFLYSWHLYYYGKTQDKDTGLILSPLLLFICIIINYYFRYYQ